MDEWINQCYLIRDWTTSFKGSYCIAKENEDGL